MHDNPPQILFGSERISLPQQPTKASLIVRFEKPLERDRTLNLEAIDAKLISETPLTLKANEKEFFFTIDFVGEEGAKLKINFEKSEHIVTLPIQNCTYNFTQNLNSFEEKLRVPLYASYLAQKKPDVEFKDFPLFTASKPFTQSKEGKEALRLYGLLRQRQGSDPIFLTTSALGDSLNRSLGELKGFLTQKETGGICAGIPEFLSFYKARLKDLDVRYKLYETSLTLALKQLNEMRKNDEQELTLEMIELKDAPLAPHLGLVKTLGRGQKRFKGFYTQTTDFFNAIDTAHKQTCVCQN